MTHDMTHDNTLQLVTLAVYSYFLAAVFGAQWVQPEQDQRFTTLYKTSIGLTVNCRHCHILSV